MSNITVSLPDGSERELADGATALDLAAVDRLRPGEGGGRRRRRRSGDRPRPHRCPTAPPSRSSRPAHRRGPPRAAPLDRARDGPGRDPAVPRGQVLDRPGHRERLLLRLRTARRRDVHRGRPRAHRGRDARDHEGRTSRSCAPRCRWPRPWSCSPTSRTSARSSSASSRREADNDDAGEVGERRRRSASTATPTSSSTCVVGPHVPSTGKLGHFKLHEGGRRLLARQREGPDAAAHLRHGLGVASRRSPTTSTAWRRRRSATTASWPPNSTC